MARETRERARKIQKENFALFRWHHAQPHGSAIAQNYPIFYPKICANLGF